MFFQSQIEKFETMITELKNIILNLRAKQDLILEKLSTIERQINKKI